MNSLVLLCFLATGLLDADAFFYSPPATWNGLKVTWSWNVFSRYTFDSMPRTKDAAISQGFTKISSCGDNPAFLGERYVKDDDYSVTLMFDVNGFIAGIQTAFPKSQAGDMVSQSLYPVFNEEEDRYVLTAYFVDPNIICNGGRSYLRDTGTNLYIQNGSNPITDSVMIPKRQSAVDRTAWTRGECFYSMGVHYWYNVTADMDCRSFFPVFLMYNEEKLNAFGWAFEGNPTSPRYEHPRPRSFSMFLRPVPHCVRSMGLSTMHIYLTNSPTRNFC